MILTQLVHSIQMGDPKLLFGKVVQFCEQFAVLEGKDMVTFCTAVHFHTCKLF